VPASATILGLATSIPTRASETIIFMASHFGLDHCHSSTCHKLFSAGQNTVRAEQEVLILLAFSHNCHLSQI
jgi:hypothetical protein